MTGKVITMYERRLKVAYKSRPTENYLKYGPVPFINICGRWLQKAGFKIGESVVISIEQDRLIVTKAAADDTKLNKVI